MNGTHRYIRNEQQRENAIKELREKPIGDFGFLVKLETGKRTTKQNSALHKYCQLLAEKLNDSGLDMKAVLKPQVSIDWTQPSVKEYLWRPIQKAVTDKDSTKDLDRKEVSEVYETLNRHLAEKFGVMVAFPERERG